MRVTIRQWRKMQSWWRLLQAQLAHRLQYGRRWNTRTWFLRGRQQHARQATFSRQTAIETCEDRRCFAIDPLISGERVVQLGSVYELTLQAQTDLAARWEINWGDGSPVEQVATLPGQATQVVVHAFQTAQNRYELSAQAFDENDNAEVASHLAYVSPATTSSFSWTSSDTASQSEAVLPLADGSVLLLQMRNNELKLFKFDSHGDPDDSFGSSGSSSLELSSLTESKQPSLITDSLGNIYVACQTGSQTTIARFKSNGTLDSDYAQAGLLTLNYQPTVNSLAIDNLGRLVALQNAGNALVLQRFLPSGELDHSFAGGTFAFSTTATGVDIKVAADQSIRVLGQSSGNVLLWNLSRNSNGAYQLSSPTTIDLGATESASGMVLLEDGSVVIAGTKLGGTSPALFVTRYRANGSKVASFGSNGTLLQSLPTGSTNLVLGRLRIAPSGELLLSGSFANASAVTQRGYWAITPQGAWDESSGSGGWSVWNSVLPAAATVRDVQFDANGRLYWTGFVTSGNNVLSFAKRTERALLDSPLVVNVEREPISAFIDLPDQAVWNYEISAQLSSLNAVAGEIASWEITWAPGQVETLPGTATLVKHRYVSSAANSSTNYSVSAVAVLTSGERISAPAQTLLVRPYQKPTASINGPSQAISGELYTLNLNVSRPTPVSPIDRWEINWGDGTELEIVVGNPNAATHIYEHGGQTYLIRARAIDAQGSYSSNFTVGRVTRPDADFSFDGHDVQTDLGNNATGQAVIRTGLGETLVAGLADGRLLLLKYHQTGELKSAFGTGGTSSVAIPAGWSNPQILQAKELASGQLQILGTATYNSVTRVFVLRCEADGSATADYGTEGWLLLDSTALRGPAVQQLDGSVLALGVASNGETILRSYDSSGVLNTTQFTAGQLSLGWVTTANPQATLPQEILLDDQGRIVIAVSQAGNIRLARLLANGTLDTSFSSDGRESISLPSLLNTPRQVSISIQPGSNQLVVFAINGASSLCSYAFSSSGIRNMSWYGSGGYHTFYPVNSISSIQYDSTGLGYLSIKVTAYTEKTLMMNFNSVGSPNSGIVGLGSINFYNLGPIQTSQSNAFLVNQDGSFYLVGRAKNVNSEAGLAVTRIVSPYIQNPVTLGNYPIYFGGLSLTELYQQTGSTDLGTATRVMALANGQLLVFGRSYDGQLFVTRLLNESSVDLSFGVNGTVLLGSFELVDAEVTSSGDLMVLSKYEIPPPESPIDGYDPYTGSYGYGYGYDYRNGILRVQHLDALGTLVAQSDDLALELVSNSMAVLDDGSILVTVYDGAYQATVTRFIPNLSNLSQLIIDENYAQIVVSPRVLYTPYASAITLQKYLGDSFLLTYTEGNQLYLKKFFANGTLDESFDSTPTTITGSDVGAATKFLVAADGTITLGISLTSPYAGYFDKLGVMRFHADGTPDTVFNGTEGARIYIEFSWSPLVAFLQDIDGAVHLVRNDGSYVTFNTQELSFVETRIAVNGSLQDEGISLAADGSFLLPEHDSIGTAEILVGGGFGYGYGYGTDGYGNSYPYYGYVWLGDEQYETYEMTGPNIEKTRGPKNGVRVSVLDKPLVFDAAVPATVVRGQTYTLHLGVADDRGNALQVDQWLLTIDGQTQSYDGNLESLEYVLEDASSSYSLQMIAVIGGRQFSKNFNGTLADNHAPEVQAVDPLSIQQGRTLTLPIIASDSDPGDQLTYSLSSEAPVGASIDPQTGLLYWHLGADVVPQTYTFDVVVADRGNPSLSASQTITVEVLENTGTIDPQNSVPRIAAFELAEDTGDPYDLQTRKAILHVELEADQTQFAYSEYRLEFDWNLDGVVDHDVDISSLVDIPNVDLGAPQLGLPYGVVTVGVRVRETLQNRQAYEGRDNVGEWKWLNFRYIAPAPEVYPVQDLALVQPLSGQPNSTSNPVFLGHIAALASAVVPVEYDLNQDGVADGTVLTEADGSFSLDLRQQVTRAGQVPLQVRVTRYDAESGGTVSGEWFAAPFTFVPSAVSSTLSNDVDLSNPYSENTPLGSMSLTTMMPSWLNSDLELEIYYSGIGQPYSEIGERFQAPTENSTTEYHNELSEWNETYFTDYETGRYGVLRERGSSDYLATTNSSITYYQYEGGGGYGYGYGDRLIESSQAYEMEYFLYSSDGTLIYNETRAISETTTFYAYYSADTATYSQTTTRSEVFYQAPASYDSVISMMVSPDARTRSGSQTYIVTSSGNKNWDANQSLAIQGETTTYNAFGDINYADSTYVYGDDTQSTSAGNLYSYSHDTTGRTGNYHFALDNVRIRHATFYSPSVLNFYDVVSPASSDESNDYVASIIQTENYSSNRVGGDNLWQSSTGFTRSVTNTSSNQLNGTLTNQRTIVGRDYVSDNQNWAQVNYFGNEIQNDTLTQQLTRSENISDKSTENVSYQSQFNSTQNNKTQRTQHNLDVKRLDFVSNNLTLRTGHEHQTLTTSSNWTSGSSQKQQGTDKHETGIQRFFSSNSKNDENGTQLINGTSDIDRYWEPWSSTVSAKTQSQEQRSSQNKWTSSTQSGNDSQSETEPGIKATSKSKANEDSSGNGDTSYQASLQTSSYNGVLTSSSGTSSYTLNSQGNTKGQTSAESSLRGTRKPYPGVEEKIDNSEHSSETYRSQFQNKIQGRGTFRNGDQTLNEKTDSRESGNSSGDSSSTQSFESTNRANKLSSSENSQHSNDESKFTAKYNREYLADLTTTTSSTGTLLTGTESTKTSDERKETYTSKSDSYSHQIEERAIRDGKNLDHKSENTSKSATDKSGKNQSEDKTESHVTYAADGTSYSNSADSKFEDKYEFSDKYDSKSEWKDDSVLNVTTENKEDYSRENSNGKGESTITTHSDESRELQNPVVTSSWRETKSLETFDTASETNRKYNSATHEDQTVKIPQTSAGKRKFKEENKYHEETVGDTTAETYSKTTSSSLDGDTSYFLSNSKRNEDVDWTQNSSAEETKYDSQNSSTIFNQEDTTENTSNSNGGEHRVNEAFAETSSSNTSGTYTSHEKRVSSAKVEDGKRHAESESTSTYYRLDDNNQGRVAINQTKIVGKDESDSDYSSYDYDSYERLDADVTTLVSSLVDSTGSGKSDYQTQRRITTLDNSYENSIKRQATNILEIKNTDKGTFTTSLHDFWETLDGAKAADRKFTRDEEGTFSRTEKETTDGSAMPSKDSAFTEGEGEGKAWAKTWNYNSGKDSTSFTEFKELRESAINDGTYTLKINEESWLKRDKSSMSSDSSDRTENSEAVSRSSVSDSKTQVYTISSGVVIFDGFYKSLEEGDLAALSSDEEIRDRLEGGILTAYYAEVSHSETALTGGKLTTTSGQSNYTHSNFPETPANQYIVRSSSTFDEQGNASTNSTKDYLSLGTSDTYDAEAHHYVDKSATSQQGSETEKNSHVSKSYTSEFTESYITDGESGSLNQKVEKFSTEGGKNEWNSASTTHSFGWKHDFGKTAVEFDQEELSEYRDYSETKTKGNSTSTDKGSGTYKSDANWTTTNNVKNGTETSNRTGEGSFTRTTHSEQKTVETSRPINDKIGGDGRRSSTTNSESNTTDNGTYTSKADTSSSISANKTHDDSSSSKREDKGSRTEDQTTTVTDGTINYKSKYGGNEGVESDTANATFDSTNITHDETTEYTLTFTTSQAAGEKLSEDETSLLSYNTGSEYTDYIASGYTTFDRSNNSKTTSEFITNIGGLRNSEQNETTNKTTDKGKIDYEDTSTTIKNTVTGQTSSGRHSEGTGKSDTTDYIKASKHISVKHRTLPPASLTLAGQLYDLANFAKDVYNGLIDRDDYETTYNDSDYTKTTTGAVDISYDLTELESQSGTSKTGTVTHKTKYDETTTEETTTGSSHLTVTKFVDTPYNKEELTEFETGNKDSRTATKVGDGTKKVTKTYYAGQTDPTVKTKEAEGKGNVTSDRTVKQWSDKTETITEADGVSTSKKTEYSSTTVTTGQKSDATLDKETNKLVNKVITTTTTTENNKYDFVRNVPGHDDGYGNIVGYYHLEQHDTSTNTKVDTDTFESKGSLASELFDRAADVLDFLTDPFDLVEDIPEISDYEYQRTINRVEDKVADELRWFKNDSVNEHNRYIFIENYSTTPIRRVGHSESHLTRTESRNWDKTTNIDAKFTSSATTDIKNTTLSDPYYSTLHYEAIHNYESKVKYEGALQTTSLFNELISSEQIERHNLILNVGEEPTASESKEWSKYTGSIEEGGIVFRDKDGEVVPISPTGLTHEFSLSLADHIWDSTVNAAKDLGQTAREAFRSVFAAASNVSPRADYEFQFKSFEEKLQWYIDAGIGVVDNLLEAINPLSSVFEIPNIGAQFGNEDAYAKGAFWGNMLGIGVSIASGFGALGLGVGCGSQLQTLSKLWTAADTFNTFVSVGKAVNNFANGNGSWGDALDIASAAIGPGIAAYGKMKGWSGCFDGETFVIVELPRYNPDLAFAETVAMPRDGNLPQTASTMLICAGLCGVAIVELREQQRKLRREFSQRQARQLVFGQLGKAALPEFDENEDDELLMRCDLENENTELSDSVEWDLAPVSARTLQPESSATAVATAAALSATPLCFERAARQASLLDSAGNWNSRGWLACLLLLLLLFVGAFKFFAADNHARHNPSAAISLTSAAPQRADTVRLSNGLLAKRIDKIHIFDWVISKNPLGHESCDIDPARWREYRIVKLEHHSPTGDTSTIWLARHLAEIVFEGLAVGSEVELDLPEMGIVGAGHVLTIDDCPQPPAKPHPDSALVTGVYVHHARTTCEVWLSDAEKPLIVTPNHPFWSEDQQAFVPIGQLAAGAQLRSLQTANKLVTLKRITLRSDSRDVYNLEVNREHVFFVSSQGVLVHNQCAKELRKALNTQAGEEAHHLVARNAKRASNVQSKQILDDNGIHLDSYYNGVSLNPALHRGIHTHAYYDTVRDRLVKARDKINGLSVTENLINELDDIKKDLLTGNQFW